MGKFLANLLSGVINNTIEEVTETSADQVLELVYEKNPETHRKILVYGNEFFKCMLEHADKTKTKVDNIFYKEILEAITESAAKYNVEL